MLMYDQKLCMHTFYFKLYITNICMCIYLRCKNAKRVTKEMLEDWNAGGIKRQRLLATFIAAGNDVQQTTVQLRVARAAQAKCCIRCIAKFNVSHI